MAQAVRAILYERYKRGISDATLTSAEQANVQHIVQSIRTFSTPSMSTLSGRWALLTPLDAALVNLYGRFPRSFEARRTFH